MSFNSSTGVLSGAPSAAATASLTLSARDKDGVSNSDSFVLTIAAAPVPPVVGNVPDQSGLLRTALNIDLKPYVTATNGDSITSYSLVGSLPSGLSFDSNSGVISGAPSVTGSFSLSLTASDKDGVSSADAFILRIGSAPILGSIPDQFIWGTYSLSLSDYVTFTEGDPVIGYFLSGTLPSGLSFDSSSGLISGSSTVIFTDTAVIFWVEDRDGESNRVTVNFIPGG
ncbi:Ig domain-containing protein [Chitinilyticum piscinae]|uniref:Putative Ig domain-containing protein n=1 Tax=Chitinilyticum piscinae TaxID=2866724 RepID=A0A8J7FPC0_9NEIS|nr:Ig domain-containing protein [Chitinilyticum piscinae]MBE9608076.1 putative Ig domain-containing protein [Chitinilyticum piscinae]